jgi:hypothetical protein
MVLNTCKLSGFYIIAFKKMDLGGLLPNPIENKLPIAIIESTMNINYKFMLMLVACLSCRPLFSTGASHISIRLIPIARNTSGQILCKISSMANPMGASWYMPISYGLCVVSAEGITETQEVTSFDPMDYETADEIEDALNLLSEEFKELRIDVENEVLAYFIEEPQLPQFAESYA